MTSKNLIFNFMKSNLIGHHNISDGIGFYGLAL